MKKISNGIRGGGGKHTHYRATEPTQLPSRRPRERKTKMIDGRTPLQTDAETRRKPMQVVRKRRDKRKRREEKRKERCSLGNKPSPETYAPTPNRGFSIVDDSKDKRLFCACPCQLVRNTKSTPAGDSWLTNLGRGVDRGL